MHLKRTLLKLALRRHVLIDVPRSPYIFLTFDDGPNPHSTPRVLEVLARHSVKATFFMIGREMRAHPEVAADVVRHGHLLGNHTLTHPRMDRIADVARALEIDATDELLGQLDGKARHLFRPPYGHMSPSLLSFCVRHGGDALAYWSRDSMDYTWSAAQVIQGFLSSPPRPGDILLFHEEGDVAVEALERLIPEWKTQGFQFATLDEARASAA